MANISLVAGFDETLVGEYERKIFLTATAKKSIISWIQIWNTVYVDTKGLFISRNGGRITTRAVQNIVKKYVIAFGLDPSIMSTHKLRIRHNAYV